MGKNKRMEKIEKKRDEERAKKRIRLVDPVFVYESVRDTQRPRGRETHAWAELTQTDAGGHRSGNVHKTFLLFGAGRCAQSQVWHRHYSV